MSEDFEDELVSLEEYLKNNYTRMSWDTAGYKLSRWNRSTQWKAVQTLKARGRLKVETDEFGHRWLHFL